MSSLESSAQRKFGADLRRSYFTAEEGILRVLDQLDERAGDIADKSQSQRGSNVSIDANIKAMEDLAQNSGRLLRRWQRSSSLATEAAALLLGELDALKAERARQDQVLKSRTDLLAQSFEENAYINSTGVKLQQILRAP
jgi:hypothetical protein